VKTVTDQRWRVLVGGALLSVIGLAFARSDVIAVATVVLVGLGAGVTAEWTWRAYARRHPEVGALSRSGVRLVVWMPFVVLVGAIAGGSTEAAPVSLWIATTGGLLLGDAISTWRRTV